MIKIINVVAVLMTICFESYAAEINYKNVISNYEELTNKTSPSKNKPIPDYHRLFTTCRDVFELRDFARIFGCSETIEKWQKNVGDEPLLTTMFSRDLVGLPEFPVRSHISLYKARAYMELGQYSKAIESAKFVIDETSRNFRRITNSDNCDGEPNKGCYANQTGMHLHRELLAESNLVLATGNYLLGNFDESRKYQKILEPMLTVQTSESFLVPKEQARKLSAKARLFVSTGRIEEAIAVLNEDSYGKSVVGGLGLVAIGLLSGSVLGAIDKGGLGVQLLLTNPHNILTKFQIAHVRLLDNRPDEARMDLDDLLNNPEIKGYAGIYWAVLYDRGVVAERNGAISESISYLERSIDEIERQRSTINTEGAKIGFFGDKQKVYQSLVRLLLQTGKNETAFIVSERSKSRALVDMLASKNDFYISDDNANAVVGLIRQSGSDSNISLRYNAPQIVDVNIRAGEKIDAVTAIERSRKMQDDLRSEINSISEDLASLVSVKSIELKEIQRRLSSDETIISYYYDNEKLTAFIINKQGVKAIDLEKNGLENDINNYRDELKPDRINYNSISKRLFDRLIMPLSGELITKTLYIAPHGVIHYVPFASLYSGRAYLIDKYNIRHLPSASTLKYVGNRSFTEKAGTLLALGNPSIGNVQYDLPFAEKEATLVGSLFKNSRTLLRDDASKANFKQYGGQYRYLHFATHAQFNPNNPLGSALMLAGNSAVDESDRLTVGELYSMHLDADLVTLSACETGLGKGGNGDDMIGLMRGFLYAGVNHLVTTLWEIDDEATSKLMSSFYTGLKDGRSKSESLRDAQFALRKTHPHPFYWAAFQITGGSDEIR